MTAEKIIQEEKHDCPDISSKPEGEKTRIRERLAAMLEELNAEAENDGHA